MKPEEEKFEMYKKDSDGLYVTEDGHVFNQAIMDDIEAALAKILEIPDDEI